MTIILLIISSFAGLGIKEELIFLFTKDEKIDRIFKLFDPSANVGVF